MSRETTAWHLEWLRSVDRPIYMDGRPHPSPNAPHTWAGFSTGEWIGDTLRVRVDAPERGVSAAQRRVPQRRDRGHAVSDPPRQLSDLPRHRLRPGVSDRAADPQHRIPARAQSADSRRIRARSSPRSIGRGASCRTTCRARTRTSSWFAKRYNIPLDVVMAGAANMYPEIRSKIPKSRGGFGPEPPPARPRRSPPVPHSARPAPMTATTIRSRCGAALVVSLVATLPMQRAAARRSSRRSSRARR